MVTRRAALLYAAVIGVGAAGCSRSSPPPVPPEFSEAPSTGNVRVNRDGFTLHAEPNVAVNPRDPNNLLGACIAEGEAGSVIAAYASFDGGATWRNHGALQDSANGRDPTVTFDAAGRGYICANTNDLHVWRTDNGGRDFAAPVPTTRNHKLDHPWLAADPTPGPPETTHLYATWTGPDNTQLEFTRSTNAGRDFEAPRAIDTVRGTDQANFASPMLAAGPDGTIHIVYGVWPPLPHQPLRPEFPAPIRVISSTDRGHTWTEPTQLGVAAMEIRVAPDTNVPGLPTVVAHRHRPFAAAAFITRQPGTPFTDIAVCISSDRGRTWTQPRLVPRQSNDTIYTQPQLAINETGRLALSAFAHRQGLVDVVVFLADPGTGHFATPIVVTSRPFDPNRGGGKGKHGAWWIGDYQGLASTADTIHPFWNDPRTGRLEIFTERVPTSQQSSTPTPS